VINRRPARAAVRLKKANCWIPPSLQHLPQPIAHKVKMICRLTRPARSSGTAVQRLTICLWTAVPVWHTVFRQRQSIRISAARPGRRCTEKGRLLWKMLAASGGEIERNLLKVWCGRVQQIAGYRRATSGRPFPAEREGVLHAGWMRASIRAESGHPPVATSADSFRWDGGLKKNEHQKFTLSALAAW